MINPREIAATAEQAVPAATAGQVAPLELTGLSRIFPTPSGPFIAERHRITRHGVDPVHRDADRASVRLERRVARADLLEELRGCARAAERELNLPCADDIPGASEGEHPNNVGHHQTSP